MSLEHVCDEPLLLIVVKTGEFPDQHQLPAKVQGGAPRNFPAADALLAVAQLGGNDQLARLPRPHFHDAQIQALVHLLDPSLELEELLPERALGGVDDFGLRRVRGKAVEVERVLDLDPLSADGRGRIGIERRREDPILETAVRRGVAFGAEQGE